MRGLIAAVLLALAGPAAAQTALIEVRVPSVDRSQVVRAEHDADGALLLPREPLEGLTGESLGEVDALTVADLREALGPGIEVRYDPARATLWIRDPHAQLPATRARREAARNVGRAAAGERALTGGQGGPWAVLTADDRGAAAVEAGARLGPLAFSAGHVAATGEGRTTWGASLRPFARTWLSYRDGTAADPRLSLRTAAGPLFASLRTDPRTPLDEMDGRAALRLGTWTAFATTDGSGALGWRGRAVSITAGFDARANRSSVRLGFGRPLSTLSLPRIR